jgi:hypothetical protein
MAAGGRVSQLYRNDGSGFTFTGALEGVDQGAVAWGDYDNDGDLDLLLTGYSPNYGRISRIYRNNGGGSFSDIGAGLDGMYQGSVAWGDYDNDGDLDILMVGNFNCCGRYSRLYRNNGGGSFSDLGSVIDGADQGSVAWGDFDNDGDLDILETGYSNSYGRTSRVYRNNGSGSFSDIGAGLTGVDLSSAAWGDFDNDGDFDILIAGNSNCCGRICRIYRNNGGSFSDIGAGLEGVEQGSVAWGDYDDDGDLDVLVSGLGDSGRLSRVYRNTSGIFTDTSSSLEGLDHSAAAWGDLDGDLDVDLVLTGSNASSTPTLRLYRNNAAVPNTAPSQPANPSAQVSGTSATFIWDAASDAQTPSPGLTYNLRVGTTVGGSQLISDGGTGVRQLVQLGNANQRLSWTVRLPQLAKYYWSVQAVDASFAASSFTPEQSFATPFSDAGAILEGVYSSSVDWGDYDNDGDLDILLTGNSNCCGPISRIYRNNGGGSFSDIGAGLVGVYYSSAVWGDYDNDGDLDILLTGYANCCGPISRIYRNNGGGSFSDIGAGLVGVYYSTAVWGDYDNDGDLDILLTGSGSGYSRIYRNDGGGSFSDIGGSLPGVSQGSAVWGDYDNDGDLDILLTGSGYARVYRNNGGGTFADIGASLPGVSYSSAVWGDYDNDGDLDILLTGAGPISRVFRNNGGSFSDIGASLEGVYYSSAAWGDYDNDGDLDILISGYSSNFAQISRVYRNQGGSFSDISAALDGLYQGSAAWGDYDGDGDLDLLATGLSGSGLSRLYRNNVPGTANTPPTAPTALQVAVVGTTATLSWNPAIDAQTPSAGLTYNLRIGTSPGGSQIMAPMADGSTGYRRVVRLGSADNDTHWSFSLSGVPVTSTLYFSVQALDASFAGSPFGTEAVFSGAPIIQSVRDVGNDQGRRVRIRWQRSIYDSQSSSTEITGYGVWRRVGAFKTSARPASPQPPRILTPPGSWDYVLTVPARSDVNYSVVAPTLCDSTSAGRCFSVFFISALGTSAHVFFDSAPDSGCSVDNLSPMAPENLVASVQNTSHVFLTWHAVPDADFDYYAVYRGLTFGSLPSPSDRIGFTTSLSFQDDGIQELRTYYYVVTAIDFAGNESPPSAYQAVHFGTTDAPPPGPRYSLEQNQPNPFNPMTRIAFELAQPSRVQLEVFGPSGGRLATLVNGTLAAGSHHVEWSALDQSGRPLPSGEYLYRLTAGSFKATRKMVLVR